MLNLPNVLTLIRLALIPVFIILFYWPTDLSNLYAAIVFIIAALTDLLDGYLARKLKLTTKFGAFLDPVPDKIIVCTALVLIVEHYSLYTDVLYPHLGKFITIPAMIIFIAYSAALIRARRPLLAFTSTLGLLELTAQKFMLLPQMAPTTRRSLLSLPTRS